MIGRTISLFAVFFAGLSFGNAEEPSPRIWIFNGLPGDEEHHRFFEKNLGSIRKSLIERFAIPPVNVRILYGPKEAGYDAPCTRENLLAEIEEIVAHGQKPNAAPVWIVFQGHANRIPGGANFNMAGPDLSTAELARALRGFPENSRLVVVATSACGSDFLRALGAPGRIVLAATSQRDPVSETEFPVALSAALAAEETDANKDGAVSALELFRACQQRVLAIYEKEKFMFRENSQLDGDGDGRGTRRPAEEDAGPAEKIALTLSKKSKFE